MSEIKFLAELHPFFVHFPIAFFLLYCILELVTLHQKDKSFEKFIIILLISGVVFAMASVLSGNQAAYFLRNINFQNHINELVNSHENFATISVWFFVLITVLRIYLIVKKKFNYKWKIIYIGFALIGAYLVFQTGKLGGELVHKHGINLEIQK